MAFSLRHRLMTVAALSALACGASLFSIGLLVRNRLEQRVERAADAAVREVEDLRTGVARPGRWRSESVPGLQSGFLTATMDPVDRRRLPGPVSMNAVSEAVSALRGNEIAVHRVTAPEYVLIVAAGRVPSGGYAWAISRVLTPHILESWRIGVFILALATLAMVIASIHTLVVLQRGTTNLTDSLGILATNLDAPIPRPNVRELLDVADGIQSLATKLSNSLAHREVLTRELATRERLASLGRVATGIAHEVRNPLAAIKLRVDLVRRGSDPVSPLARDLGDVSDEVDRLDRLVADLLTVAGRRTGPRRSESLEALIRRRVELLAPWAREREVNLDVVGTGTASLDADAFARAIDNLLRNAIEVSPRGETVRVRIERDSALATVSIEDHGPGVPPERESELFEPFFTTKNDGTGLGLALSRAIAEAHGGKLIYRREDSVTRFVLELPSPTEP